MPSTCDSRGGVRANVPYTLPVPGVLSGIPSVVEMVRNVMGERAGCAPRSIDVAVADPMLGCCTSPWFWFARGGVVTISMVCDRFLS